MIVDSLRVYKQPVFVYLPRGAELRGGAWVVVDPTINPDHMEMYADTDARGGVLEPEGTVQVKMRRKVLEVVMARLDRQYADLAKKAKDTTAGAQQQQEAAGLLEARYAQLAPIYHQVAVKFADLHDTPGRMKAKGCINAIVPWPQSRKFFYWRLKRRVHEATLSKLIQSSDPTLSTDQVQSVLRRSFTESAGEGRAYLWDDDAAVAQWIDDEMDGEELHFDSPLSNTINRLRREHVINAVKKLVAEDEEAAFSSVLALMEQCSKEHLTQIKAMLGDGIHRSASTGSFQSMHSLNFNT